MDIPTLPNIIRDHEGTIDFFRNLTGKTVIVATGNLAGTDYSREMIVEYRERMIKYERDTDLVFVGLNCAGEAAAMFLNDLGLSTLYDCPSVIFVTDYEKGAHVSSYKTYNGFNFKEVFDEPLKKIKDGKAQEVYGRWEYAYKNLFNSVYWEYVASRRIFYFLCFASVMATPIKIILFGYGSRNRSPSTGTKTKEEELKEKKNK